MEHHRIIIIDFGSQYTQLIARAVREAGVLSEVVRPDLDYDALKSLNPQGIILSGGPMSAYAEDALHVAHDVCALGCPVLGICYGMQMLAHEFGAEVHSAEKAEYGRTRLSINSDSALFDGIKEKTLTVWMSHGDALQSLPHGFTSIASSDNCPIAAIQHLTRSIYAIQFHPEVTHTQKGRKIIDNFLFKICECKADWQPKQIIDEIVTSIRDQVGESEVILALSGGVDSSVAALLLQRAIGDRLKCFFVDNGLLRLNESESVMQLFSEHFKLNVKKIDAAERFYHALAGIEESEKKRHCIGHLFIKIFEEQAKALENVTFLAQGTIYSDVIESAAAASHAEVIKSHHNVGGLPEKMNLKIVEPLRHLFKDEVRKIGLLLGMPDHMIHRHPFPGPGLAVRIMGTVDKTFVSILQKADAIFMEALYEFEYYDKVSQAFAVFLPIKSVGVVGDRRQEGYVIALRAVESRDFMTADWAHLPHEFLSVVTTRIINAIPDVSRVVYDISSKPPATIEWE